VDPFFGGGVPLHLRKKVIFLYNGISTFCYWRNQNSCFKLLFVCINDRHFTRRSYISRNRNKKNIGEHRHFNGQRTEVKIYSI
jgi:hypothetical protein